MTPGGWEEKQKENTEEGSVLFFHTHFFLPNPPPSLPLAFLDPGRCRDLNKSLVYNSHLTIKRTLHDRLPNIGPHKTCLWSPLVFMFPAMDSELFN